jgi:phosphoenolpyruvate carboxylase
MLGYSDSTRDGSSLASEAEIIGAALSLLVLILV